MFWSAKFHVNSIFFADFSIKSFLQKNVNCIQEVLTYVFLYRNKNKSFIDRFEVHINIIVKKGAYITLTPPPPHTHTTIIKYVNINLR